MIEPYKVNSRNTVLQSVPKRGDPLNPKFCLRNNYQYTGTVDSSAFIL